MAEAEMKTLGQKAAPGTRPDAGVKLDPLAAALRKCLANPVTRSALARAMLPIFERAVDAIREEDREKRQRKNK
jgi:hypothetical protein